MDTLQDIEVKDTVSFQTKHPTDNIEHSGKVLGISSYDIAKAYFDIASYSREVKKEVPSLTNMEEDQYILLQEEGRILPVAFGWIDVATLKINFSQRKIHITVYDIPESEDSVVLDLLRSKGYCANITG